MINNRSRRFFEPSVYIALGFIFIYECTGVAPTGRAADSKSEGPYKACEGSTPSTRANNAGVAQLERAAGYEPVGFGSSNLSTGAMIIKRVWYKGCALAFQARDVSSSLTARSKIYERVPERPNGLVCKTMDSWGRIPPRSPNEYAIVDR